MRSSRYMKVEPSEPGVLSGLGVSASRVAPTASKLGVERRLRSFSHVPHQPVGDVKRPEFYQPFSVRFNPLLEAARKHALVWGHQVGLTSSVAGMCVWDEPELAEYDFALCAAACQPDASQVGLDLTTDWFSWATFADDYFPLIFARARDLAGGRLYVAGLDAFMPLDCGATPTPRDPVECGLADLWHRTAAPMKASKRPAFRELVQGMLQSWVWELVNHIENRVPDPVDYIEMRRQTFGAEFGMSLAQFDRRMRSIVHVSPRQFLTRVRVEAAAAALEGDERALSDIALVCGFYDQASFSRQFRQATGLTPTQYRRATRG